jgi:hypothetical protein
LPVICPVGSQYKKIVRAGFNSHNNRGRPIASPVVFSGNHEYKTSFGNQALTNVLPSMK